MISALAVSVCACGKTTHITIEDIENYLVKAFDNEGSLDYEETSEGYTFQYIKCNSMNNIDIKGVAYKNKNVQMADIKINDILREYFGGLSPNMITGFMHNTMNYNTYRANSVIILMYAVTLMKYASDIPSDDPELLKMISVALDAIKEPQTENGWKYSYIIDEYDKNVTFHAEFIG